MIIEINSVIHRTQTLMIEVRVDGSVGIMDNNTRAVIAECGPCSVEGPDAPEHMELDVTLSGTSNKVGITITANDIRVMEYIEGGFDIRHASYRDVRNANAKRFAAMNGKIITDNDILDIVRLAMHRASREKRQ